MAVLVTGRVLLDTNVSIDYLRSRRYGDWVWGGGEARIRFLSVPNEPDRNKFLDVWFIGGGGREGTEAKYRALLHRAGFTLARVVPTEGSHAILEGRPS